jgi:hypothetical protein
MKMEQILEHLLAEIRTIQEMIETNQVKMVTNQEKMNDRQEEIKDQVSSLASWIDPNQEEMKTMLDACLEKMGANPGELQSVVVHQEVPQEEATVETTGALEDPYGDRHLAKGHCQQLKKWTQGDGGSRKKLATARRQMTHFAIPPLYKGHGHQGPGKDDVVCGTLKGWMLERHIRRDLNATIA